MSMNEFMNLFNSAKKINQLYGVRQIVTKNKYVYIRNVFCCKITWFVEYEHTKDNRAESGLYLQIGRKEGTILFNDALNTFYLRLYGVRHMVKDH